MSVKGIEHVAVAVPSIDAALSVYRDLLGWTVAGIEEVVDQQARVARLTMGPYTIELVEPLTAASPVGKFLEKRGPGLHHICLEVGDIRQMLDRLSAAGVQLIDRQPRAGAHDCQIAFVHPKATGGVLMELSEPRHGFDPEATQVGSGGALTQAGVERLVRAMEAAWAASDFDALSRHYHPEVEFAHPSVAHGSRILGRERLMDVLRTLRPVAQHAEAPREIERIFVAGNHATIEWGRSGPAALAITTIEVLHGQIFRSRTFFERAAMLKGDFSVPI